MGNILAAGLIGLLVVVNVLLITVWATTSPIMGMLTLAVYLLQSSIRLSLDPLFSVGRVGIYPEYLFVLLVPALLVRVPHLLTGLKEHRAKLFVVLYSLVLFFSFGRGLLSFGAGVGYEARRNVSFALLALYFASFSYSPVSLKWMSRILSIAAIAILAVAGARWFELLLQPNSSHYWTDKVSGSPFRVLEAGQTAFLAQVWIFVSLGPALERIRLQGAQRFLLYALPAAVIMLQHRSVWVGVLGAVIWVILNNRGAVERFFVAFCAGLVVFSVAMLIVPLGTQGEVVDSFAGSVAEAFQEHSSLQWRLQSWAALLSPDRLGVSDYAMGEPMGSGFLRYVWDQPVDVQPHNYYIEMFLRTGLFGLGCLVGAYWVLLRGLKPGANRSALSGILVFQLTYFMAYGSNYDNGVFLGLAVALFGQLERTQREMPWVEVVNASVLPS